ncbi:hypothetical protein GO684_01265 [Wolbachia endosymbiont of Litomosoides brasiliensis]|nr:hypothetical protein [Wolbachia endosymbiont of Litomosoides brasiliensis]
MDQISDIAELFNYVVRKRGNKFAKSVLKQNNCIIDFITQVDLLTFKLNFPGFLLSFL